MIRYAAGDATQPRGSGPRVIVHVCNDVGGWGAGFVLALSRRWQAPEARYRDWHRHGADPPFALGAVQLVEVEPELWVANLIGQEGVRHRDGRPPVRYEAIRTGLSSVAAFAEEQGATIHMPRIGAGLAGGDWATIEKVIEDTVGHLDVTVYDLPR